MKVIHDGETYPTAKALDSKLANQRPLCRVCGSEMSRGRELCVQCDPGYEAARADFVAWLRSPTGTRKADARDSWCADKIEAGEADGFSKKGP